MDQDGNITSHLSGLLYRTSSIVEKGIKPIYVLMENILTLKQTLL